MNKQRRKQRRIALASAAAALLLVGVLFYSDESRVEAAPKAKPAIAGVPKDVSQLLNNYCIDCHSGEKHKGKVRFDTLSTLAEADRAGLLSKANESVHFEEMPPSNKPQPTEKEREKLLAWFSQELGASADAKLKDKMRYPHYGNVVDHDLLFSGEIKEKAYTPARRWLVSPQIFKQRVLDVFELEGRERENYTARNFYGVTNPFVLPADSGVKDYDIGQLSGGHLLVMLNNAKWIAGKQVFATKAKIANHKNLEFENPKDRWYPRNFGPESFKAILQSKTPATDEQLMAAIQKQFDLALKRPANAEELSKYLRLMRQMVDAVGNETALRQMCKAVLLESEFLYRVQFGGGRRTSGAERC